MYKLIQTEVVEALNYGEEREDTKKVLLNCLGVERRIKKKYFIKIDLYEK